MKFDPPCTTGNVFGASVVLSSQFCPGPHSMSGDDDDGLEALGEVSSKSRTASSSICIPPLLGFLFN